VFCVKARCMVLNMWPPLGLATKTMFSNLAFSIGLLFKPYLNLKYNVDELCKQEQLC